MEEGEGIERGRTRWRCGSRGGGEWRMGQQGWEGEGVSGEVAEDGRK